MAHKDIEQTRRVNERTEELTDLYKYVVLSLAEYSGKLENAGKKDLDTLTVITILSKICASMAIDACITEDEFMEGMRSTYQLEALRAAMNTAH